MGPPSASALRIGEWNVDPLSSQIARGGETLRLEARTLKLLLCLAEHAGETVATDELMRQVWAGTIVTQDSVYQAVTALRRQLGDDPKNPAYILTVPRRGYRMVAKVLSAATDPSAVQPVHRWPIRWPHAGRVSAGLLLGALALAVAIAALVLSYGVGNARITQPIRLVVPQPESIMVLPFLDLTSQAMDEEYFADGMTEELIGRLSKIPGLQVPPPTTSFYFKGKRMTLGVIAREANVAYVLDGSVRKSGLTLRIAARLVRAEDGFIIWSEAYDRPAGDLLNVQGDIADQVAKMIASSHALRR